MSSSTENTHCPGIDYLIIINLEATISEEISQSTIQVTKASQSQRKSFCKETAEIIEFAWAIVDTKNFEVVYQHSQYVKPKVTLLTTFCTTLTNITWDQLEFAGNLKDAIDALDDYIQNKILAENKTFCFCTHGAWDLRIQLPREAKDKEIELSSYLTHCRMFDLKQEYQRWHVHHPDMTLKTLSLQEMSSTFDLIIVEIHESGLNDVLTMVNVVRYFCSFGHHDVFVNPIDTSADLNQFKKEQSKVIHLAGLPHDVTQPELEAWFSGQGVRPTTLSMIKPPDNQKSSGIGFAIFATHEDSMACLDMNGRTLGDRVIEVSPSSERIIEAAGSMLSPFQMIKNHVRPGDWICSICQFHNFSSRRTCFKCNTINPNPLPVVQQVPHNFTQGDWMCPNLPCSFHNYASRTQCLRCGTYKPSGNGISFRPGDWICPNPNCIFQNFASRTQCMRCGTSNHSGYDTYGNLTSSIIEQQQGGGLYGTTNVMGDWYCPSCNSHNFASRFQCIRCSLPKPPNAINNIASIVNMKPGDWLCGNDMCGYHNFAKRTQCAKCVNHILTHNPLKTLQLIVLNSLSFSVIKILSSNTVLRAAAFKAVEISLEVVDNCTLVLPLDELEYLLPEPLFRTSGYSWDYQKSNELRELLRTTITEYYKNYTKQQLDKSTTPLFFMIAGAGEGKSRNANELPNILHEEFASHEELKKRFENALVFNISFENGTKIDLLEECNAVTAIAKRMLFQLEKHKGGWMEALRKYPDVSPDEVVSKIAKHQNVQPKDLTIIIVIDGMQAAIHQEDNGVNKSSLFYSCMTVLNNFAASGPFVIGCSTATLSRPFHVFVSASHQKRVFLPIPSLSPPKRQ
ncbi:12705_t:CDS:2 [Entrophospora sp. SA101]|nr:12705_t:CDS:2 [Entrophospora sp. SA101]